MERLDKILSRARVGSRKEVRALIKKGRVFVHGTPAKDPGALYDKETLDVCIDEAPIDLSEYIYLMMHKPKGLLSATRDEADGVVCDLLTPKDRAFDPFPVGRLDKDTTGLLLLTNDGELNHRLLSPRWHVDKVYRAYLRDPFTRADSLRFRDGIVLEDGTQCRPANMELLDPEGHQVAITLQEGKFHQVKRMVAALGNEVLELHRCSFGPLTLPEELPEGAYSPLTPAELLLLKEHVASKKAPSDPLHGAADPSNGDGLL
ncbi:Ribosomal small subunit pseudouridine synthase A [Clostridiaceae bacterium JG1575]|nr:Ribosomal small subunit pseudouridine synthase A [Clostridiaceae bacterium JG1575]